MGAGVQLLTVVTWGQGGPAAYSGYMGAGGPAAYSGHMGARGLAAYSGYMGARGPVAYSGYMGAGGPVAYSGHMGARGRGYMREGVQLLTVDSEGWGSSCLQWVHDSRGSSCIHVHGAGVQLLTVGTWEEGVQLLTVGTWGAGDPAAHSGYMRAGGSGGCMG